MSFKREGDDGSQLNLLKKRRVAELLAKDIPDDEAILMSNGRYACTVCHYKPVFDTVDMLSVHRAGRKHLHATEHHFAKKKELALLVQKRRIENELKKQSTTGNNEVEEPSPLLKKVEAAKRHTLLKEAPYNPCHTHKTDGPSKKSKNKLFFQGIRQINLKDSAYPGTSSNHIAQNSNSTNEERVLPHQPMKFSNASMGVKQTPVPAFSSISQGNNNADTEAPISKFTESKPVYKSTSQTPTPGVSNIQIKPYIPKSKRNAINLKASSSNQPRPEPKGEKHASTSSPDFHSQSLPSVQSLCHGEEVVHSGVEYISEFQNTDNKERTSIYPSYESARPVAHVQKQRDVENRNSKFPPRNSLHYEGLNMERLKDAQFGKEMQAKRKDGQMVSAVDRQNVRVEVAWKDTGLRAKGHHDVVQLQSRLSGDGFSRDQVQHVRGFPQWKEGNSQRSERGFLQCKQGAKVMEEKSRKGMHKTQTKDKSKMSAERRKELQKHLDLTSSGWIQDNNGKWIKDEDVEFDSDEEPPAS